MYLSQAIPVGRLPLWRTKLEEAGASVVRLREQNRFLFVEDEQQAVSAPPGEPLVTAHYAIQLIDGHEVLDWTVRQHRLRALAADAGKSGKARKRASAVSLVSHSFRDYVVCCCPWDPDMTDEMVFRIHKAVIELGGTVATSWDSSVTHLVSARAKPSAGTAKASAWARAADGDTRYEAAASARTPIVTPAWVWHSWSRYTERVPVDRYLVKPFAGVVVSITEVSKPVRVHIQRLVARLGGEYLGSMQEAVTHLIAHSGDVGREKIDFALTQGLQPVVGLRWLVDSYRSWSLLDPEPYVLCDQAGRRADAVDKFGTLDELEDSCTRDSLQLNELISRASNANKAYLAAHAIAPPIDLGSLSAPVPSTTATEPERDHQFEQGPHSPRHQRRSDPDVHVQQRSGPGEGPGQPGARPSVSGASAPPVPRPSANHTSSAAAGNSVRLVDSAADQSVWHGALFTAAPSFGAPMREVLSERLAEYGARLVTADEARVAQAAHPPSRPIYCLGLHGSRESMDPVASKSLVTTEWLVRCHEENRILPCDQSAMFRPLPFEFPLEGAEKLECTLSGFSGVRKHDVELLAQLLGLQLSVNMTKKTTYLICAKAAGRKWKSACHWGLKHILNANWLEDSIAHGRLLPEAPYALPRMPTRERAASARVHAPTAPGTTVAHDASAPSTAAAAAIPRRSSSLHQTGPVREHEPSWNNAGHHPSLYELPPSSTSARTGVPAGMPPPNTHTITVAAGHRPIVQLGSFVLDGAGSDDSDEGGASMSELILGGTRGRMQQMTEGGGGGPLYGHARYPGPLNNVGGERWRPGESGGDHRMPPNPHDVDPARRPPSTDGFLFGVCVYVVPRGISDRPGLHKLAVRNGATVVSHPVADVTHVVSSSSTGRALDAAVTASGLGAVTVSPLWLEQSDKLGTRLDERDFPPGVDPRRTLSTLTVASSATVAASAPALPIADMIPNAAGWPRTASDGRELAAVAPAATHASPMLGADDDLGADARPRHQNLPETGETRKRARALSSSSQAQGHKSYRFKNVVVPTVTSASIQVDPPLHLQISEPAHKVRRLSASQEASRLNREASYRPTPGLARSPVKHTGPLPPGLGTGTDENIGITNEGPVAGDAAAVPLSDAQTTAAEPGRPATAADAADALLADWLNEQPVPSTSQALRRSRGGDESDGTADSFAHALSLAQGGRASRGNLRVSWVLGEGPGTPTLGRGALDQSTGGGTQSSWVFNSASETAGRGGGAGIVGGDHGGGDDDDGQDDDATLVAARNRFEAQQRALARQQAAEAVAAREERLLEKRRRGIRREQRQRDRTDGVLSLDDFDDDDETQMESVVHGVRAEEKEKRAEVWRKVRLGTHQPALRLVVTKCTPAIVQHLSRLKLVPDDAFVPGITTHVISTTVHKSEKFMTGCANGAWVLHPSFLEQSPGPGQFADPAAHEWTPERYKAHEGGSTAGSNQSLAEAPRRNRLAKARGSGGAFANMRAMIYSAGKEEASFRAILAAGGCTLVNSLREPGAQNLSFVLVTKKREIPDKDLRQLCDMKVLIVRASYVIDLLSKPPPKAKLNWADNVYTPAHLRAKIDEFLS